MFSGLTNQVTSWMGAVKGDPQDEDVPAPPPNSNPTEVAEPAPAPVVDTELATGMEVALDEDGAAKAKKFVSSLFESGMFSNVKGWLGNASIPSMPAMPSMPNMPSMPAMPAMPSIPGLRKGAGEEGNVEGLAEQGGYDAAGAVSGDDEDKSRYISATEGADSHPASGGGTPTGEDGQIGQVTTKVTQGAKHFGSFLYSAVNKAGAKIKETVKDNTILGEFNKEQEAFIKGQGGSESGQAPWSGHSNEAKIKEEIMGLSLDRRNFVRAPPAGVDFQFDYDTAYPTAIAIMAEDQALEKMRFELVPKIITEENFWRNYFYRVSLIIQAAELGTLGVDGVGQASSEDAKAQTSETNSSLSVNTPAPELGQDDNKNMKENSKSQKSKSKKSVNFNNENSSRKTKAKQLSESEFVSDTFQTTETDLEEIKDGMRKLGIDSMTQQALENNEEQWEKDLEAELQEYEVVTGGGSSGGGEGGGETSKTTIRTRSPSNNDWEQYADLIDETDDLK